MKSIFLHVFSFITLCLPLSLQSQVHWHRESEQPVMPAWSGNSADPNALYYVLDASVYYDSVLRQYLGWVGTWTGSSTFCISHATSSDGVRWYYYSRNPVLSPTPGSFDEEEIRGQTVIRVDSLFYMYYMGRRLGRYNIGLATSADGIQWEKYPNNPVLNHGGSGDWDARDVLLVSVVRENGNFMMWYSGRDGTTSRIGLATSLDGKNWIKHAGNPVVDVGSTGSWDAYYVESPAVVFSEGVYYMIYNGRPSVSGPQYLGLAMSTDGIQWKKYEDNPVFVTRPGSWESANVAKPSLMLQNNIFRMWYSGLGGRWQVGYATSPLTLTSIPNNAAAPTSFEIGYNYPNPFNPTTQINISVPSKGNITVDIYDVLGRQVATLADGVFDQGRYSFYWNGNTEKNQSVSSGVYFCKATFQAAGSESITSVRKMNLLK